MLPHIQAVLSVMTKIAVEGSRRRNNLAMTADKLRPKTVEEENERIVGGTPWTAGRVVRHSGIGAAAGAGAAIAGGAITGHHKVYGWLPSGYSKIQAKAEGKLLSEIPKHTLKHWNRIGSTSAVLAPRRLSANAITGAALAFVAPLLKQKADVLAAKEGLY